MRYTVRPLSDRMWLRPAGTRKRSRFESNWTSTITVLGREIDLLGGREVVIEVDVREEDIRNDGMLRANARSESPAVVVAFESLHGPMLYRCDALYGRGSGQLGWQQNVRAIALTLEALRAVSRYGATETGQQYTGYKALPSAPSDVESFTSPNVAAEYLRGFARPGDTLDVAWRAARRKTHPDHNGGDHAAWHKVERAAQLLGLAS